MTRALRSQAASAPNGSHRGGINGYTCDDCGETAYVVHVDDGVTPMFLTCRAGGKCKGRGISLMYPQQPIPEHVKAAVRWEWFRPDLRGLEPEMREHVEKGGLDLRPLTDEGRQALVGGSV